MKTYLILFFALLAGQAGGIAQTTDADQQLANLVATLDKARSAADYEQLEKQFAQVAQAQQTQWVPYYYAALCNANIGFLYQDDGEKIEPFSNRGDDQIKKAQALLSTEQKRELSEVYVVMSMINQAKVFINPMTYGREFGPVAQRYRDEARQLDPANPRAIYLAAWFKYNTPKMWGGDKAEAKQLAEEALQKVTNTAPGIAPHWGKQECQTLLSQYK
jgi:hypothetical protein